MVSQKVLRARSVGSPKNVKNRFSFCSIFFHGFNGMFSLRKRLKKSFDLLDTHYAAGEFPSAGVAPSSNKVS